MTTPFRLLSNKGMIISVIIMVSFVLAFFILFSNKTHPSNHQETCSEHQRLVNQPTYNYLDNTKAHVNHKHLCVTVLNYPSMPCERESILRLVSGAMLNRTVWYRFAPALDKPQEWLCHDVAEKKILEETNYLLIYPPSASNAISKNFKTNVLEKFGVLFPHTKVVQYIVSDEVVVVDKLEQYEHYDASFRNYWNNAIMKINSTLGNIYQVPLFSCYPFLSNSIFPVLPPSIMHNPQLLDDIVENQFSTFIPASKRKFFCFFRGQPRGFDHDTGMSVLNDLRAPNDPKQICHVEFTKQFNTGDKVQYSLDLMNAGIVLCQSGSNPEQFRIWESLESGAVPIPENAKAFEGFLDFPLKVIDTQNTIYSKHPDVPKLILHFYSNKEELDNYQKLLYKWWFYKKVELALKLHSYLY